MVSHGTLRRVRAGWCCVMIRKVAMKQKKTKKIFKETQTARERGQETGATYTDRVACIRFDALCPRTDEDEVRSLLYDSSCLLFLRIGSKRHGRRHDAK
jgi:hypothetical protein